MMIFMMQFIKVSVCHSLRSEEHFTILPLSAALVSPVADDAGGPQQQGQCQAHEASDGQ